MTVPSTTQGDETMQRPPLGILIGGSSHVGKTTFATRLSRALDRALVSTDGLARHPGRPWPSIPPQVAEYYASLSHDTVHWFLKVHHENMWPRIGSIIDAYGKSATPFVMEGSALRPDYVAGLDRDVVETVFLYADDDFLRARMMREAAHADATLPMASIIDKFIERSIRENREMLAAARDAGIACVDVAAPGSLDALHDALVATCSRIETQ
jgi:2-phosphoglycerate kinase